MGLQDGAEPEAVSALTAALAERGVPLSQRGECPADLAPGGMPCALSAPGVSLPSASKPLAADPKVAKAQLSRALGIGLGQVDAERLQGAAVVLPAEAAADPAAWAEVLAEVIPPMVDSGHVRWTEPAAHQEMWEGWKEGCQRVEAMPDAAVLFALNVQDWLQTRDSARTIERLLDLHERYGVPIDVYMTGPALRGYQDKAPRLVERLQASPLVAISHHARPPMPYYQGFDHAGLSQLEGEALYQALMAYETRAMDMVTGQLLDAPGGYGLEASVFGYPPVSVGLADKATPISRALARVFVDLGAEMVATHSVRCDLGAQINGLWCRPEHGIVKLFTDPGVDAGGLLEAELQAAADHEGGPFFLWAKVHESDFYAETEPWRPIYYQGGDRRYPLAPPYDLKTRPAGSLARGKIEVMWRHYESALRWVADNTRRVTPVNLRQVTPWLEGSGRPEGI